MNTIQDLCSKNIDFYYEINKYTWGTLIQIGQYQLFLNNHMSNKFVISSNFYLVDTVNYHDFTINIITLNYEEILLHAIKYFQNYCLFDQFYLLEKEFNKHFSEFKNNYEIVLDNKLKFKFVYKNKYCFYISLIPEKITKKFYSFIDLESKSNDRIKLSGFFNLNNELTKFIQCFKKFIHIDKEINTLPNLAYLTLINYNQINNYNPYNY